MPAARTPPWRNVRVLRIVAQVVTLAVVLVIGWWLFNNLLTNMRQTRLSFGFEFLDSTAGFEIGETLVPYSATDRYRDAFLAGIANTLLISLIGIILATILGILTGVARLSNNWLVSKIAAGYVELMRNTPLLVQLVLIYAVMLQLPAIASSIELPGSIFLNQRGLFLPRPVAEPGFGLWLAALIGGVAITIGLRVYASRREALGRSAGRLRLVSFVVLLAITAGAWIATRPLRLDVPVQERFNFVGGLSISPELTALLFGLVIYTAAFIGEVVRGGIQAVRRGQIEAAQAIGLSDGQTLRLIVFPQALRVIVPPLTSQYLNLAKNSSLAIAVGFADLFSVSRTMANQTGQPVSVIVLVMAAYLVISLLTSLVMNLYNRRVQVLER
ncbi:MAG: amino acid ABC transporter permease [Candidatus Limnocylindrales bacterium]